MVWSQAKLNALFILQSNKIYQDDVFFQHFFQLYLKRKWKIVKFLPNIPQWRTFPLVNYYCGYSATNGTQSVSNSITGKCTADRWRGNGSIFSARNSVVLCADVSWVKKHGWIHRASCTHCDLPLGRKIERERQRSERTETSFPLQNFSFLLAFIRCNFFWEIQMKLTWLLRRIIRGTIRERVIFWSWIFGVRTSLQRVDGHFFIRFFF